MSDLQQDKTMDEKTVKEQHLSEKIHSDTMYFVGGIVREFRLYPEIIDAMRKGNASVELRKRVLLRAVDETWVTAVEDCLPALDEVIRKPSYNIVEREEVLPIELTKTVTDRSIKHLAQHTDYISKVEGDTITPNKLLNVFHDETNQTYENRFVNTLILRLFTFVNMRYEAAKKSGQDVKNTSIDFSDEFLHGDVKGKVHLRVELEQSAASDEVEKNGIFTSDLWRRVERLNKICADYMSSTFVRDMGKAYIRPPVMRTNALLKNKSLRQCLSLWEFIESYENTGLSTVVEDKLLDLDEAYIRELYSTMAMEYLLFRDRVENGFDEGKVLAQSTVDEPLKPEIVEDLLPATAAEFALHVRAIDETIGERTAEETEILKALEVALLADEVFRRREEAEEARDVYDRSFLARLVLAQEPAQTFYTDIKNYLLSFAGVSSRISWRHESYTYRSKQCARLTVRGKTLCVFLPLDPSDEKYAKYHIIDKSKFAAHKSSPFCVRVRSRRTAKYVLGFIDEVMQNLGTVRDENAIASDYHYPFRPLDELIKNRLIRLKNGERDEEQGGSAFDSKAFMARLVLAQEPTQTYYSQLKNRLLSHDGVKSRVSWKFDTFSHGRTVCARMSIRGKTLTLFLNVKLSDEQAEHFRVADYSDSKQYEKTPVAVKVKSQRGLKYALELVDLTMRGLDIAPSAVEVNQDFRIRSLERQELISKNWLKPGKGLLDRAKTAVKTFAEKIAEDKSRQTAELSEENRHADETPNVAAASMVAAHEAAAEPALDETSNAEPALDETSNAEPALDETSNAEPALDETSEASAEIVAAEPSENFETTTETDNEILDEVNAETNCENASADVSDDVADAVAAADFEQISADVGSKNENNGDYDLAELIDAPMTEGAELGDDPTNDDLQKEERRGFLKRLFGSKNKRN